MIEDFVKIDTNTGEIVIKRNAIGMYDVFNRVLRRKSGTGIPGDADGRKKHLFLKELGYIYIVGNPRSYPHKHGYSSKEIREYARKVVDMPDDWMPDQEVEEAIDFYKRECTSTSTEAAYAIAKGLKNWITVIDKATTQIDDILNNTQKITAKEIKEIVELNALLLEISEKAPAQITRMEMLIKDLQDKEINSGKQIRGNEAHQDSMDPDSAIK